MYWQRAWTKYIVCTEKSELQGEMREKFCEEINKIMKYNDLEIIIYVI